MSSKKVYVGSIPGNLSEETLTAYFRQFVGGCTFALNKNPHRITKNNGFGFLTVSTSEELVKILQVDHYLQGRRLKCEEYLVGDQLHAARDSLKKRRIFIRNLKKNFTDGDLQNFFKQFGELESAYVVKVHSTGRKRSFGYVTYKSEEPAVLLLKQGSVIINGVELFVHPFRKPSSSEPADLHDSDDSGIAIQNNQQDEFASITGGNGKMSKVPVKIRSQEFGFGGNPKSRPFDLYKQPKASSLPSPQLSGDHSLFLGGNIKSSNIKYQTSMDHNRIHYSAYGHLNPVAGESQQFLHLCSDIGATKPTRRAFHIRGEAQLDHNAANIQLNLLAPIGAGLGSRPLRPF